MSLYREFPEFLGPRPPDANGSGRHIPAPSAEAQTFLGPHPREVEIKEQSDAATLADMKEKLAALFDDIDARIALKSAYIAQLQDQIRSLGAEPLADPDSADPEESDDGS